MKRFLNIFIATLILLLTLPIYAFAGEFREPTNNFFVNDFADVIDSKDEEEIMAIGSSLFKQTTAQVVVVTVDSLDGYDEKEYALKLGREWGVGSKEKNNGVVLLMAVKERKVTIQVGYGLEGCLPDGKTGRILDDYAIPYLSKNDFSTGLTEAYKAITSTVYKEYDVTPEIDYDYKDYLRDEDNEKIFTILKTLIILAVIAAISFSGKGKGKGRTVIFGPYVGGSSSGGSYSGGGGGFSGGGGSFGGGGSSRGF